MVAQELFGERSWRWLVTDRWSTYPWDPTWPWQVCGAHLLRDIEAMIERGGRSQEMGEALRAQIRLMFQWWHRVRSGTLAHTSFASSMRPTRQEVERLLEAGHTCGMSETTGGCREVINMRQVFWTFVRHPEVEPTNHVAEVRFVGRKPNRIAASEDWPHVLSGKAARRESLIPVSV